MEYTTLYNGVKMPMMSFGVFLFPEEICEQCVLDALDIGYRAFDTAQAYNNEHLLGNALQRAGIPREELFSVQETFGGLKVWRPWRPWLFQFWYGGNVSIISSY